MYFITQIPAGKKVTFYCEPYFSTDPPIFLLNHCNSFFNKVFFFAFFKLKKYNEGLRLLHGLETNLSSSLQTPQED